MANDFEKQRGDSPRNGLEIPAYIRCDIGFSALLVCRHQDRSHSPFLGFDNIRASLEVFNIIDRDSTISFLLIKDFSNTTYTITRRLTPRGSEFEGGWEVVGGNS